MRILYEELVTVHKVVVRLHDMQNKCKDNAKSLKVVLIAITIMHEWEMQHKGAPPKLVKKTRKDVELEKAWVQMLIQSNKQIASFIANI